MTDEVRAGTGETITAMADRRLARLRDPFDPAQMGHLPRITCRACRESPRRRCDEHTWVGRCPDCRGSHTSAVIHLDYVGHAAVTDRLLEVDPYWSWDFAAQDEYGNPVLDGGCLWIKLTVCGVTRLGVGDDDDGRARRKVLIGDAIRNAAMRFGVALDLWAKEDLRPPETDAGFLADVLARIDGASTIGEMEAITGRVRENAHLLDDEAKAQVSAAWKAKRDLMGNPT